MDIAEQITCQSTITARQGFQGPLGRENIITDTQKKYPVPLEKLRIWDAYQTLITTAANDDLGITAGTFGTGCPYVHAGDMNAAGSVTRYARTMFQLPAEYVDYSTVTFNISGGMLTSVASVAATVDVEVYKVNRDTLKTGSDLVATAATSINSTTFADKGFTLTSTGLLRGDILDVRFTIAANSATASSHFAAIAAIDVLLDVKG